MSGGLFESDSLEGAPLAARLRPMSLDEIAGQAHLTGAGTAFRRAAEAGKLGSILLWGPPGVGKTTLAELVASLAGASIHKLSAVSAGVQDLRKVIEEARSARSYGRRTVLFIDEIHRFNKAQQDAILQVVEDGMIQLIGATTENPSFEVNSALQSRCRVFVLRPLTDEDLMTVLERALEHPNGLRRDIDPEARRALVGLSNGDARALLGMLELAAASVDGAIGLETVKEVVQRRQVLYDKSGEQHFDQISALHKSVRDSDVDGALYWLARMLDGGEDPMYLARRLVRMAVEDIGLANPDALPQAIAAQQAMHFLGQPEGALALAQCTALLALSPKSNSVYVAFKGAQQDVEATRNDPVPMHLRNAPTNLMKDLGYGSGYKYAHDFEGAVVEQTHLPESLSDRIYYRSSGRGWEGSPT